MTRSCAVRRVTSPFAFLAGRVRFGLRFPDECCRHKALDLIGDLALIGKPLLGHVIAEKAGHAMHFALVNKIMSDPTIYEIITHEQVAPSVAMVS